MLGFEDWWAIYPRKVGKGAARKAWKRLKCDLFAAEMIEKLQVQVDLQYAHTEKQFIPHPTTYLNQERWEDEVEDRRPSKQEVSSIYSQADAIIREELVGLLELGHD